MNRFPREAVAGCLVALLLALIAHSASAASVTFPTDGYYRVGRYLPVKVSADRSVSLEAPGAAPLEVSNASGASVEAIAPWLAFDEILNPRFNDGAYHDLQQPLHALGDGQRLVACFGDSSRHANDLWPEAQTITVHPPLDQLTAAPARAWQALDGIVLDPETASRVTERTLADWLSAGIAVALDSGFRPTDGWPWERRGHMWVVRPVTLPATTLIDPAAYGPTYGWLRGQSRAARRRVLAVGLLMAMSLAVAAMLRARLRLAAIGTLATLFSIGCVLFASRQFPLNRLEGDIVIHRTAATQTDHWTWLSAPRATRAQVRPSSLWRPVASSRRQLESWRPAMVYDPSLHRMTFSLDLPSQGVAAFIDSTLSSASPLPAHFSSGSGQLQTLVEQDYLVAGRQLLGCEAESGDENQLAPVHLRQGQ